MQQAYSYLSEHDYFAKDIIRVAKQIQNLENSKLMLLEIQSRHSNAIDYRTYVKYQPSLNSFDAIEGWYCTCKDGARTVGCCSHVASLILNFSVYKDSDFLPKKTDFCSLVFTYGVMECSEDEMFDDKEKKTKKKNPSISKSQPSKTSKQKQKKKSHSQPSRIKKDSTELEISIDESINELNDSMKRLLSSTSEPSILKFF